jgi:colanic acid biosynthesis glycosyl transferase WcaI
MSVRILIVSQVYIPDPASVGQHLHDAAVELVNRSYKVKVVTHSRGYDDPAKKYARRECVDGVDVLRVATPCLGKRSIIRRIVTQICFLAGAFFHGIFTRKLAMVLISTSPPMCSVIGVAIAVIRRVPLVYWVMDINPDQAVATGSVRKGSVLIPLLEMFNRLALRHASAVITLDRFMASRLASKIDYNGTFFIIPPWPHEDHLVDIPRDQNPFYHSLGVDGKFIFMYSGNHAVTSPISTFLKAAERLKDRQDIVFVFVGGGVRKREVEKAISDGATNIITLPYQPLESLCYSLSAADIHLVSLDKHAVGIVHPCKAYGAMVIGRPILFLGPETCHISEILAKYNVGERVEDNDIEGTVRAIEIFTRMAPRGLARMGRNAKQVIKDHLSKNVLCPAFVDVIEYALAKDGATDIGSIGQIISYRYDYHEPVSELM